MYRKITWDNLNDNFGITAQRKKIFYETPSIQPSAWLIQAIKRGLQSLGIRIFNQKKEKPTPTVYGCVTTGSDWQFLLLQDKVVWVDTDLYYLGELPKLLGILQTIVDKAK